MGTHQHRSLDSGHWGVLGTVGGFEQVHQHVRAGSLSRDRESAEPKYCARHDRPDAGCSVVDGSGSVPLFSEGPRTFYLTMAGFALFLAALLITIIVEVPIVKQIETWRVSNLPGNWQELRDRWLAFHVI